MKKQLSTSFTLIALGLLISGSAYATNGMLSTARTARSAGMGGASVGVIGFASAVDVNPANLSYLNSSTLNFTMSVLDPTVEATQGGDTKKAKSQQYPIPTFSYAFVNPNSNWTYGIGAYAQGGMGASYDDIYGMGPVGTHESEVGYGTLNLAASYAITPQWSVGIAPFMSYSSMEMKTPSIDLEDMTAYGFGVKLGTTYRINKKWTVGLSFKSEDDIDYDGDVNVKMMPDGSPIPNNKHDGSAKMAWPSELTLGTSYHITNKLIFATDVKWVGWKSAMEKMEISSDALGPNGTMDMPLNWDDQMVYSVGMEYLAADTLRVRLGYNYGKNPVPTSTIMPLFPAIVEHHITAGLGYDVNPNFTINGAIVYGFNNSSTKTDTADALAKFSGTESSLQTTTYSLGFTYRFPNDLNGDKRNEYCY